jgi:hypothetical protein
MTPDDGTSLGLVIARLDLHNDVNMLDMGWIDGWGRPTAMKQKRHEDTTRLHFLVDQLISDVVKHPRARQGGEELLALLMLLSNVESLA